MITAHEIMSHFNTLAKMPLHCEIEDETGKPLLMDEVFSNIASGLRKGHQKGNTVFFIGNGGSAAISSHMAIDYQKNGGIRSLAFNDASALTCITNDLGYENVFAHHLDMHARDGDTLIAISSSGLSANILEAVNIAKQKKCNVITLSGFEPNNKLRGTGDINFYVPSMKYGFVEVTHLAILHAILDLMMEEK